MISYYCWDFSTILHNKMAETICSMLWLFQPFHSAPQSTIRGAFQWWQNWFPLFQLTSSWKIATFLCSFSPWSDIIRQIREKHQKVPIYYANKYSCHKYLYRNWRLYKHLLCFLIWKSKSWNVLSSKCHRGRWFSFIIAKEVFLTKSDKKKRSHRIIRGWFGFQFVPKETKRHTDTLLHWTTSSKLERHKLFVIEPSKNPGKSDNNIIWLG